MLEFLPQDGIEVYASNSGFICFRSDGVTKGMEEQIVCLTIGQFRSVIKNSEELIAKSEANKAIFRAEFK